MAPEERKTEFERLEGELDASIRRGLADAEAGRAKPAQAVFDRLDAKYRGSVDHQK